MRSRGLCGLVCVVVTLSALAAVGVASSGAATGSVVEFAAPGGPRQIVAGPDGNLWFTTVDGHVGRMSAKGVQVEFPIAAYAEGIAVGSDGNLWFLEPNQNVIGHITPAGTGLTECSLPTIGVSPVPISLAPGSDGNLWIAVSEGNAIDRVTPAATCAGEAGTAFLLANATSNLPNSITPGADGNLWFSEGSAAGDGNAYVGRISTSGVDSHFPNVGGGSNWITAGSDGNLWLTGGASAHAVYRVPTSGAPINGFDPVMPLAAATEQITAGADGNLWFDESGGDQIGRITTNGTFTTFPLPSSGVGATGIALGPDGNIWFDEYNLNKIGRLTDTATNTAYALVLDPGYAPKAVTVKKQGTKLDWTFQGGRNHSVSDSSGMGLFDSGVKTVGSIYTVAFKAAGSYGYHSTVVGDPPSLAGTITVPIVAKAVNGSPTQATVTWASGSSGGSFVSDIQVKGPTDSSFRPWLTGQTATHATFTEDAGPGKYQFQARLRNSGNGFSSGYSPAKSVTLG